MLVESYRLLSCVDEVCYKVKLSKVVGFVVSWWGVITQAPCLIDIILLFVLCRTHMSSTSKLLGQIHHSIESLHVGWTVLFIFNRNNYMSNNTYIKFDRLILYFTLGPTTKFYCSTCGCVSNNTWSELFVVIWAWKQVRLFNSTALVKYSNSSYIQYTCK